MRLLRRFPISLILAFVVSIMLVSCGGEGSGPVTASSMTSPGGTSFSGIVGQALLVEVVVTGSNGKAFAGGVVTFAVTGGGGQVSPSQANTDQTGKASATWILGTTTGSQSLSVSAGAASLQFTATVAAGPPNSVESVSSFPGQFLPGESLTQPAEFVVRDQHNNNVSGASVAFDASDGGSANPSQGTTGSDGRVSTIWTLGPVNGVQTLSASITGISPASVTAEAYDPCLDVRSYSIGQTANGTLTTGSCEIEFDNEVRFADLYKFPLTSSGAFQFTVTSSFLNPFFLLFDPGIVAGETTTFGTDLTVKAFLDNGSGTKQYYPWIASDAGGVGTYSMSSGATVGQMQNCDTWVSTKTLTTNQAVSVTDCAWTFGGDTYLSDFLTIWLEAGETLTVTEASTFFDPYLWLLVREADGSFTIIAQNDDFGGTLNSRLVFTAATAGFYHIAPTTFDPLDTGSYAMTISSIGGSGSPQAVGASTALPGEMLPIPPLAQTGNRILRSTLSRDTRKKR